MITSVTRYKNNKHNNTIIWPDINLWNKNVLVYPNKTTAMEKVDAVSRYKPDLWARNWWQQRENQITSSEQEGIVNKSKK